MGSGDCGKIWFCGMLETYKSRYTGNPHNEKSFLIFEPEKPGNKGKFVIALLPERRFYLKFISIQ